MQHSIKKKALYKVAYREGVREGNLLQIEGIEHLLL